MTIAVTVQLITVAIYLFAMALFLRLCFYDLGYLVRVPYIKWIAPFIGVIVLIGMIKPLFAMPSFRTPPVELAPEEHPLIHRYVYRLCELLNAPRPRSIWVDSEPNASASLRYGIFSIAGNNLILTIGLPLVSTFTLRQLTGVIAHELGHFNQKAGMRVPLFAHTLNQLIHRIVYERDTFDQKLDDWSRTAGPIGWFLKLARLFNWLNRGMLWLMMMINHALVSRLLRMMEFDADQYEVAIGGSREFAVTAQTLALIGYSTGKAHEKIGLASLEKRLPDDLPLLIKSELKTLPATERKQILAASEARQAPWYESHPSDSERIQAAAVTRHAGTHKLQAPASILFPNYAKLCKDATRKFYVERAPELLKKSQLVPTASIIQESGRDDEAAKAVERYFQGAFDIHRPIVPIKVPTRPTDDLPGDIERLKAARGRMVTLATQAWGLNREHREHVVVGAIASIAKEAIEKGVPIVPEAFGLTEASVRDADQHIGDAQTEAQAVDAKLRAFESVARERLELGLRLLFDDRAVARLPRERIVADRAETERMLTVVSALERNRPLVNEISRCVAGFSVFVGVIDPNRPHPAVVHLLLHHGENLLSQIRQISNTLNRVAYPFEGTGTANVGEYLVAASPEKEDLGAIASTANELYERFGLLMQRISSRLTLVAENVETALGLARLADASAGADPLAGLYQEIAADKQKKQDAERDAATKNQLIFGPEARAAAAAVLMLALLTWFYLIRETPGSYERPTSRAVVTPHRPSDAPAPPRLGLPSAMAGGLANDSFAPNDRVRYSGPIQTHDAIVIAKASATRWSIGYVTSSSDSQPRREYAVVNAEQLTRPTHRDLMRANGTITPKFIPGDRVIFIQFNTRRTSTVERILSSSPVLSSYLITDIDGEPERKTARENQLRLIPRP